MIVYRITDITATAQALKHTRKYGEHVPICTSVILADKMEDLVSEKIDCRHNSIFPIAPNISNSYAYMEIQSQTLFGFREMGAEIHSNGFCKITHYREHDDEEHFIKNALKHQLWRSAYIFRKIF